MKRRFAAVLGVLLVATAPSCSSSLDGPTQSRTEQLAGACGGVSLWPTYNNPATYSFGTTPTMVLVPSTIPVDLGNPQPETVNLTLVFDSLVTCNYTGSSPGYPVNEVTAALTSCNGGVSGGSGIKTTSMTLTVLTSQGFPNAYGEVALDLDDGEPCTIDRCVNGQPDHTQHVADGTVVASSCNNGTTYCEAGQSTAGAVPPAPADSCHAYTCNVTTGQWDPGPSTCSTPSLGSYNPDTTVPTNVSTEFQQLFANQQNIQIGSMDSKRLAVLRGRVLKRDGSAAANVAVTAVGHSEFGTTYTRSADGGYDMVVNGGQTYTLQFSGAGYLTAQRQAEARWLDWTTLATVTLVAPETPTTVDLSGQDGLWQRVRGAPHGQGSNDGDPDGARQATILIPPTTTFTCTGSGCASIQAASASVHATEYTVGAPGPSAMPGALPPQSGYTYAIEAGFLDGTGQPIDANVTFKNSQTQLAQPVLFYLENFIVAPLDATNGTNGVPAGSYDKASGEWKSETSGKTYCIIGVSNGMAQLGLTCGCELGTGCDPTDTYANQSPSITDGERTELASSDVYGAGVQNKQVWRVSMPHFTGYDLNWGAGAPQGAQSPPNAPPRSDQPNGHSPCNGGSIIECENQVLRESIPIAGTPYTLNYRSETQAGYHPTITVPVADGTTLPSTLARIEAEIQVAGQDVTLQGKPTATGPQNLSWSWDRTDAYGNPVQGAVIAHVEVRYVYGSVPFVYGAFAEYNPYQNSTQGFAGNRAAREVWFSRQYELKIGAFDDQPLGLGGWTLSAHQVYQPASATLFRGDGRKQDPSDSPEVVRSVFTDVAGTNITNIEDLAVGADGNVWVLHTPDTTHTYYYLGRIDGGSIAAKTSGSENWSWLDGDPISYVCENDATAGRAVIAEPGGSILFEDLARILRVVPVSATDLRVYLVAGDRHDSSTPSFGPDGAMAKGTALGPTRQLAEMTDGSILFTEYDSADSVSRVRRIKPDGTLETVIGGGATDITLCSSTCSPQVRLGDSNDSYAIAARDDGSIFLSSSTHDVIWRLDPHDGQLHWFAGILYQYASAGDGLRIDSSTKLSGFMQSFLSTAGSLLFIPGDDHAVRKVDADGIITRFAGVYGVPTPYTEGLFAASTPLRPFRLILGPDNYYYTTAENDSAPGARNRVVRFRRGDETPSGSDILVPSDDGSVVYEFDASGRHLYTRSRYSGTVLLNLATGCNNSSCYNGNNRLTALPDAGGTTNVSYTGDVIHGNGTVTISSQTGQTTTLNIQAGHLHQLQDPGLNVTCFTYDASNRLAQLIEPLDGCVAGSHTHNFSYSSTGLLVKDVAPAAGAGTRLIRTDSAASYSVEFDTAESRATLHNVDMSATPDSFTDVWSLQPNAVSYTRREQRSQSTSITSENGTIDTWYTDSTHVHQSPEGTKTSMSYAPDPRFGMSLPYVTTRTVTTGSHDGSGKCQSGWNGYCERMTRTADGVGFAATKTTDTRWGSFNGYDTNHPDLTVWDKSGTADPSCNSLPCVVKTSPQQRKLVYGLDSDDRVTKVTIPGITNPISIQYGTTTQSLGKLWKISQGSRTYTINYDPSGFVGSIDTPLIAAPGHTITFGNDADGRPTQQVFVGGTNRTVNMHYDANGNRDWLKLPKDPTGSTYEHQFIYNARNLLATYQPPISSSYDVGYAYDLDGLLSGTSPPTGNFVTNVRDAEGRVTEIDYSHPVDGAFIQVLMSYDAATGQPCTGTGCSATNGDATGVGKVTTTDSYDGYLLAWETTTFSTQAKSHTIYWNYDKALRRQEQYVDAVGNFTDAIFNYDNDSLVSSVSVGGQSYSVTRDPGNGRVTCTCLGSMCESYCYDAYGALTDQEAVVGSCDSTCNAISGNALLLKIHYDRTVDPSGRITAKNETIGSSACNSSYGYDSSYPEWLRNFSRSGSPTYCNLGSSTQNHDADGNPTGTYLSYDQQDRMTWDGYWTYGYDAQGNVLSQHDPYSNYDYFYYDPIGNLRSVTTPSYTTGYDVDFRNRRVGKIKNGAFSEGYLYDGDRVVAHLTSSGDVDAAYVYVTKANVPDLVVTSGTAYRLLSDQIGSARELVTAGGAVQNYWNYDLYGVASPWPNSGAPWPSAQQPFGFAGGLWDGDVGLYRFGARDYNPWKGRWWSKDPIRFAGGLNLYGYCNNDPVNCTDINGLWGFGLGVNIGYAVGAGSGSGGYVEIGIFYNHDTGAVSLYSQTAHADDAPGIGLEYGVGASATIMGNGNDFWGHGAELSIDAPRVPYGPNVQGEFDDKLNFQGVAFGPSAGVGGGVYGYTTDTYPIANLRNPVPTPAPIPCPPK